MQNKIKGVLFDVFGTLILYPKTERWAQLAAQVKACGLKVLDVSMVRAYGQITSEVNQRKLYDDDFRREAEAHTKVFYLWYYCRLLELLELGTVQDHFGKLAQRMFEEYVLLPGYFVDPQTLKLLQSLQARGLRLGIVSNGPRQVRRVLQSHRLDGFMNTIVISDEFGNEKPHAAIFHRAQLDLRVAANECIFVGDVPAADMVGARNAGMHGVLIDRQGKYPNPEVPCICIRQLSQLPGVLGL